MFFAQVSLRDSYCFLTLEHSFKGSLHRHCRYCSTRGPELDVFKRQVSRSYEEIIMQK